jgi:hypothetical protein
MISANADLTPKWKAGIQLDMILFKMVSPYTIALERIF